MNQFDLVQYRLYNQQIAQHSFTTPGEVAAWLGAIQAQDYPGAKWSIGLRLPNATNAAVEQALADKSIVRTWSLRGTLHVMAAADVRWILALLRPRLDSIFPSSYRQLEQDTGVFTKCQAAMARALEGGRQLTRQELSAALEQAQLLTPPISFNHVLVRAALDGLICLGNRRGNEFTYTLLDEWLPPTELLDRDEALAEFSRRYFISHGPATLRDFAWWSGLTLTEAKTGLNLVKSELVHTELNGQTYWMSQPLADTTTTASAVSAVYLLPGFDEYLLGYTDRSAPLDPTYTKQVVNAANGLFSNTIVADGRVVGIWKRTIKKDTVVIKTSLFTPLSEEQHMTVAHIANQYGQFMGMTAVLPSDK